MDVDSHPFFLSFPDRRLSPLVQHASTTEFQDGDVVFEEASESTGIYLVLEGCIAFRKRLPNGEFHIVSESSEGDFFGEIGVLMGQPRALQAVAVGRAVLAHIPVERLNEYLQNLPGPVDKLLFSIVKHLHGTTAHFLDDVMRKEKMAVVGQMMNTIIHDFKNPFCLISLGAQLIEQIHDDQRTQRLCENIREQVNRMVAMAAEITEYSRGSQDIKPVPIDLRELLRRFHALNSPFFNQENVTITINCSEERCIVLGEESKLMRVVQNLVTNAIEAVGDKAGGEISINAEPIDATSVALRIRDNGPGIPEEIRSRFFEPFVTLGKSGGTGLGTAIVKSILDAHGAEIRFVTSPTTGTVFYITLPRAPEKPPRKENKRRASSWH